MHSIESTELIKSLTSKLLKVRSQGETFLVTSGNKVQAVLVPYNDNDAPNSLRFETNDLKLSMRTVLSLVKSGTPIIITDDDNLPWAIIRAASPVEMRIDTAAIAIPKARAGIARRGALAL